MIEEIQRNRKEIVDKLYVGDLDERLINFVESVYIKGDNKAHIMGRIAEDFHQKLKKTVFDVSFDK